jgi:transcriptional regulator with XRE-family HTH domain
MQLIKKFRLSLKLSPEFVAEQTGLTILILEKIELGALSIPDELTNFYSVFLKTNPNHLKLLTTKHKMFFASLVSYLFDKYISLVVYLNAKK